MITLSIFTLCGLRCIKKITTSTSKLNCLLPHSNFNNCSFSETFSVDTDVSTSK
jgi:hypothetical protein